MIVVCTVTGDTPTPSCAAYVQAKIGARNAFAFDVGAACAGSLYGLVIADQFIRSGMVRRALVIGAETLSRVVDWTNRETCVLFGDAAGAILLGATRGGGARPPRRDAAHRRLDDRHPRHLRRRQPPADLAGAARRQRTTRSRCAAARFTRSRPGCCPRSWRETLAKAGLAAGDVDHVICPSGQSAHHRVRRSTISACRVRNAGSTSTATATPRAPRCRSSLDEANRAGKLKKRRRHRHDGDRRGHDLGWRSPALVKKERRAARRGPPLGPIRQHAAATRSRQEISGSSHCEKLGLTIIVRLSYRGGASLAAPTGPLCATGVGN